MEFFISLNSEIFPGFYNTYLDPANSSEGTEVTTEMFEKIKQDVCYYVIDTLQENSPFHIVSANIWSPSTYNYANDTIDMVIETTPEAIMYEILTSDYLEQICFDLPDDSSHIFTEVLSSFMSIIADEFLDEEELFSIVQVV